MNTMEYQKAFYVGLPWKDGGTTRAGIDCRGLALLWLREQMGFKATTVPTSNARAEDFLKGADFRQGDLQPGDVVFFRRVITREIRHVAIYLGADKYLHTLKGCSSRIDNGVELLRRLGFVPAGAIAPGEADRLCAALGDPKIGETATVVLIVVSILLTLASIALAPKLARQGNKYGRYGSDALVTQNSPELPLPDLLGSVVTAGNSPYTQLIDKTQSIVATTSQRWNKIVVFASAPCEEIDYETGLEINGLSWKNSFFKNSSIVDGFVINPAQTKAEAVTGTIYGTTNVPSVTLYDGAHDIEVPVDVRAQYDRSFPVYGLSGCSYAVFRLIDSSKFSSFNVTCRVKCRKCRTFDEDGFTETSVVNESLSGADGSKVRFKLAFEDIVEVTAVTVDGTSYSEIGPSVAGAAEEVMFAGLPYTFTAVAAVTPGATYVYTKGDSVSLQNDTDTLTSSGSFVALSDEIVLTLPYELYESTDPIVGYVQTSAAPTDVYALNRTKGYIEFITAPDAAATVLVSYTYYPREWTQNPASQAVYLLTEPVRGKGFAASKIDWASAVELRDYCDEGVIRSSSRGQALTTRYQSNYAADFRKPIQEHLRAVLDSCYGYLFLSDGKFVLKARAAAASVFSFDETNILVEGEGLEARSTFLSELTDRAERANRLKVLFHSEESRNAETEVIIDDTFDQRARSSRAGNNGVVDENLKFPAVTSQAQAERLAEIYLAEQVNSRWVVKFSTNIQGLALQPGDLIDVTHGSQPSWAAKLFRVEALGHDENDHLSIEAAEYFGGAFA